ncbi:Glycophorin-C-like [Scleropages formosus]|uniref:Glycophorin-C-like n=1 Tax=Scleropages formosus TaxID=113540 RepID=A0A0P7U7M2_SCLFO|nr:Glycophorin-C-like [Scleropages formosus]
MSAPITIKGTNAFVKYAVCKAFEGHHNWLMVVHCVLFFPGTPILPPALHSDYGWYNGILAGVVIAIILVLLILAAVLLRYMYRHKGSYHTNEAKGTEHAETADAALRGDPALREAVDDSKKEYFI